MIFSNTSSDSSLFTYEYFLTDHLGSTRMVINAQEIVTEAQMYHPYGTMVPIGSISSALPVRGIFISRYLLCPV